MGFMDKKKIGINWEWLKRAMIVCILDVICIAGSFFLALWIRYEFSYSAIPTVFLYRYAKTIFIWAAVSVFVFSRFRLYNSIWVFVGIDELFRIIMSYGVLLIIGAVSVVALHI